MNTIKLTDPKTGREVEFETRFFSKLRMYRIPGSGDKGWVFHPPFPEQENDGSILETTSILQRFFGLPGLTTKEQNFILEKWCTSEISEEDWDVCSNTMSQEDISRVKKFLQRMAMDKARRLEEADNQKSATEDLKDFYSKLPVVGDTVKLPCGHAVMRTGAVMSWYIRTFKANPELRELKCQVDGKPFTRDFLREQLDELPI